MRAKLAAEAAAHEPGDDLDGGERQPQRSRDLLARAVDILRGEPDGEARAIPGGDAAMRLQRVVQRGGRLHARFDGDGGCGKRGLGVAPLVDGGELVRNRVRWARRVDLK